MSSTKSRHDPDKPALIPRMDRETLATDLARVRYYGVGQPLGTLAENEVPSLARLARLKPSFTGQLSRGIEDIVVPAVRNLYPEKYRMAACALLWIELDRPLGQPPKARRRKPVAKRRQEAAALLGKKIKAFERRHERPLLEAVADQLIFNSAQSVSPSIPEIDRHSNANFDLDEYTSHTLRTLASDALALQFAGLVTLFISASEEDTSITRWLSSSWLPDRFMVEEACARDIFKAHLRFIMNVDWEEPWVAYSRPHYVRVLGDEDTEVLKRISDDICDWGPRLPASQRELVAPYLGHMEQRTRGVEQHFSQSWRPWYWKFCRDYQIVRYSRDEPRVKVSRELPLRLMVLVAKCGYFEFIVRRRVGHTDNAVAQSRQVALKRLASRFLVDEFRPIAGGLSLVDRAERYFDSTIAELADEYYVWYKPT